MQVDHWGLHWEGPYPFLVEPQGSVCLLKGHEDWKADFTGPKVSCPHRLIEHISSDAEPTDPTPFTPVPDQGAYTFQGDWRDLPINVVAWWAQRPAQLVKDLTSTNITPLCIVGYRWSNLEAMLRFLELPRLRPLIFLGDFHVPNTQVITSQNSFSPASGLAALRKFVDEAAP